MKNIKLTIVLLILTTTSLLGQEFLGVKVDGKKDAAIAVFKSKGFILKSDKDNSAVLNGTAGGKKVELFIHYTPISKLVWGFFVFLPEKTSWYSLKAEYQEYLDLLTEKYGEPKDKYNFFSTPYDEGDGYELQAVELEKCSYSAFWEKYYSIKITKWKQVKIAYENEINSALDDKETKQINKNAF
jgi:hypothetical protein